MCLHNAVMPKPTTKSAARHDMVMGQLMEAAERLFAQKGVAGTSLQELADAVGLTRTGVYHYVKGKDEMLETLVRGFTVETADDVRRLADSEDGTASERLRSAVTNMAERVALHPQRFRLLLNSEGALSDSLARQYRRARRDTLSALTDLISQSITEGSSRAVDPELAAFSLAGAANWVAFWYPLKDGAGSKTPREVAEALADIALKGLAAERASETDGVPHVLGLLRDDLDRLQHMLANE
jgi:AcrR family transcriptional regulator